MPPHMTDECISGFEAYVKDAWYWPADLLQDLLNVSGIDVLPFPIAMPMFEQSLSIPNVIAYVPQVGIDYTPNMVSHHIPISKKMFSSQASCVLRSQLAGQGSLAPS